MKGFAAVAADCEWVGKLLKPAGHAVRMPSIFLVSRFIGHGRLQDLQGSSAHEAPKRPYIPEGIAKGPDIMVHFTSLAYYNM